MWEIPYNGFILRLIIPTREVVTLILANIKSAKVKILRIIKTCVKIIAHR